MTLKELKTIIDDLVTAGYGKQPLVHPNDALMDSGKPIPIVSVALMPFDENSLKPKIRIVINEAK